MADSLTEFQAALLGAHPFSSNRVNDAADDVAAIDVAGIHQEQFERLQRLAVEVGDPAAPASRGVILRAAAGVGKSHLLARLCRWGEQSRRAVPVFLHNITASPERMPRHFLRAVLTALRSGRGRYRSAPLYDLLHAAMKEVLRAADLPRTPDVPAAHQAFLRRLAGSGIRDDRLNEPVCHALFVYFQRINMDPGERVSPETRQTADAVVEWLAGSAIDREAAAAIGLHPQAADLDDEQQVRLGDDHDVEQVLLILCAVAHLARRTFLICLDQFDNLGLPEARALSRFLHAFLDHAKNLLLITSGLSETLLQFKTEGVVSEAQWDRLGQEEISLRRIEPALARDLVESRLQPFRTRLGDVPELAAHFRNQPLFPLAEKDYLQRFGDALEVRPRDVVSWGAAAWRREQERIEHDPAGWLEAWGEDRWEESGEAASPQALIDRVVAGAVHDLLARRLDDPEGRRPIPTALQRSSAGCARRPSPIRPVRSPTSRRSTSKRPAASSGRAAAPTSAPPPRPASASPPLAPTATPPRPPSAGCCNKAPRGSAASCSSPTARSS